MLKLNNSSHTPNGGFRYTQPESGVELSANSFEALMTKVREHRIANNYQIGINMEAEVEHEVCRNTVTDEWCREVVTEPAPKRHRIGDVLRFTKTLADKFLSAAKRITQEEASSRAAVCAACPDNVPTHGCDGCGKGVVQDAIRRVSGAGVTPHDDNLKTCRWCGCFNAAQIWFPLEILQKNMSEKIRESLPQHCWKK
tara:strand:+ start:5613 stop:6206 length:594 start_codon:yes stop_codon:yes gene_type:complete